MLPAPYAVAHLASSVVSAHAAQASLLHRPLTPPAEHLTPSAPQPATVPARSPAGAPAMSPVVATIERSWVDVVAGVASPQPTATTNMSPASRFMTALPLACNTGVGVDWLV